MSAWGASALAVSPGAEAGGDASAGSVCASMVSARPFCTNTKAMVVARSRVAGNRCGRFMTPIPPSIADWIAGLEQLPGSNAKSIKARLRALQLLVAFAVIAAALLDPLQAAIAVAGLVSLVLVVAGLEPLLAGAQAGVFRIHRGGKHRVTDRGGRSRCS